MACFLSVNNRLLVVYIISLCFFSSQKEENFHSLKTVVDPPLIFERTVLVPTDPLYFIAGANS